MSDNWMTDEHVAAALEGIRENPVAQAYQREYARQQALQVPDLRTWLEQELLRDKHVLEVELAQRRVDATYDLRSRALIDRVLDSDQPAEVWLEAVARVESHGRVLLRHRLWQQGDDDTAWIGSRACRGCGLSGMSHTPVTPDLDDCPELRDAAVAFRHRLGYRREWAP
jgi:hypothetical protein